MDYLIKQVTKYYHNNVDEFIHHHQEKEFSDKDLQKLSEFIQDQRMLKTHYEIYSLDELTNRDFQIFFKDITGYHLVRILVKASKHHLVARIRNIEVDFFERDGKFYDNDNKEVRLFMKR